MLIQDSVSANIIVKSDPIFNAQSLPCDAPARYSDHTYCCKPIRQIVSVVQPVKVQTRANHSVEALTLDYVTVFVMYFVAISFFRFLSHELYIPGCELVKEPNQISRDCI